MNWINDKIAIGNYLDAENSKLLIKEKISSIVGLDGKPRHFNIPSEIFNLIDGAGNDMRLFRRAVDTLSDFIINDSPVLVYCHAGRSRSIAVVAGYFITQEKMEPDEALILIEKNRKSSLAKELEELLYFL